MASDDQRPEDGDAPGPEREVPTSEDGAEAGEPVSASAGDTSVVFVSYRVHPDQAIAGAVKRLIESALTPPPRVFVSGLGGLRPSAQGFKPQLQDAVQSAKAFVAVITPASRDREWIFFEAGAAWGARKLYAPLLVNTSHGDLPSTIADYQATRADARDEVERMIAALADTLGLQMKPQFGKRFAAFQRQLEEQKKASEGRKDDDETPVGRAMALMTAGKVDEANAAFDAVEADADDPEDLAYIKVVRRIFRPGKKSNAELLGEMDRFDARLKETATFAYWSGSFEGRPHVAIDQFRRAIGLQPQRQLITAMAYRGLADRLESSGRAEAAAAALLEAVCRSERPIRAAAAARLAGIDGIEALGKVVLFAVSAAADVTEAPADAVGAAEAAGLETLALYLAERADAELDTGTSRHEVGRALETLELHSLAFRAYAESAERGVSVAKVNAARLVHAHRVASAGLDVIEHSGRYDAAAPHYPHQVRAELEEAVHRERETANGYQKAGARSWAMLMEFGDVAVCSPTATAARVAAFVVQSTPPKRVVLDGAASRLGRFAPFDCMFTIKGETEIVLVAPFASPPRALLLPTKRNGPMPAWLDVTLEAPASTASTASNGSDSEASR